MTTSPDVTRAPAPAAAPDAAAAHAPAETTPRVQPGVIATRACPPQPRSMAWRSRGQDEETSSRYSIYHRSN